MSSAPSRQETEPKAELKPSPARRRRLRTNLIWTVLNSVVATSLLGAFLYSHWQRDDIAEAEPTMAQDPVTPSVAPTLDPVQTISRADSFLSEGSPAVAAQLYRRVTQLQQAVTPALAYRMAVCFELLGETEDSFRHYRTLAEGGDSLLALAAQLGQARLRIATGQLRLGRQILSRLASIAALPEMRASGIGEDVEYLLALMQGVASSPSTPAAMLAVDTVRWPDVAFSPDHLLGLVTRQQPAQPNQQQAEDKSQPAAGVTVQSQTDHVSSSTLSVYFDQTSASDLLDEIATSMGWQWSAGEEVRQVLHARTARIHLQDVTVEALLTLLLEPLHLTWEYNQRMLTIRRVEVAPDTATSTPDDYGRMERSLRSVLAFYPNHVLAPHAYLALGNLAVVQNQFDRAASAYREVAQRFPSHSIGQLAFFNLAKLMLRQQRTTEAMDAFYRVIDERTGQTLEPATYLFLGRLHLEAGNLREAVRELSRALSLATSAETASAASLTLASAYLLMDNPHSANMALMERRDMLQDEGNRELAALLAAVARLRADSSETEIYRRGRDVTSAIAHVAPADFFGDFGYLLLGDVYAELGLVEPVERLYQDAIDRNVTDPIRHQIMLRLALHLRDQGSSSKSNELLEAVVASKSARWAASAQLELAKLALHQGLLEECLTHCQRAIDDPALKPLRVEFLRLMGQVYERRDDYYNAAVCFAGLAPGDPAASIGVPSE